MDNRQLFHALSEQSRNQFLELRALLRDIHHHEGQIIHKQEALMSVISDFGTAMNAYFDETGASIDELKGSVNGLAGDVAWMKARIDELQNNPGPISPEDQKILNDLQARAVAASANAKDAVAQVKALDEATPPVVPPEVLTPPPA